MEQLCHETDSCSLEDRVLLAPVWLSTFVPCSGHAAFKLQMVSVLLEDSQLPALPGSDVDEAVRRVLDALEATGSAGGAAEAEVFESGRIVTLLVPSRTPTQEPLAWKHFLLLYRPGDLPASGGDPLHACLREPANAALLRQAHPGDWTLQQVLEPLLS